MIQLSYAALNLISLNRGGSNLLRGKQRSYLKKLAHNIDPIFQVGKNGISDSFLEQLEQALEARELVKVKVLDNSFLDATAVASEIVDSIHAEFVQSIGNKFVIYRESKENPKIILPK